MSKLKVNQVKAKIRQSFEEFLDLKDIKVTDKGRDDKILSRSLAALAIKMNCEAENESAAYSVIDGGDDDGIDSIYYDQIENEVILAQAKWKHSGAGEPEAKDISTFIDGVKNLIEHELDTFREEIRPKLEAIYSKISKPGVTIKLIIISTGSSTLAKHSTQKLERFKKELNGNDDEMITYQVIGLSEIYTYLARNENSAKELDITIENWHSIEDPHKGYYGTIDGLQLREIWEKTGKKIISENIRGALGDTEVNTKIKESATQTPNLFWYFNNGITFIANKVSRAAANTTSRSYGTFRLDSPSIVNGAQTISTLSKISETDKLEQIRVGVRVISLEGAPEGLGAKITQSNNLQNRVENRDFVAQDDQQQRLHIEMHMEGVEYRYIRDQEEGLISEKSCSLIEATIALACASGDVTLAVAAKTGTGRFFLDLKKPPYKSIFNPKTSGSYLFNTVLTLRLIDNWLKTKISELPKKSGAPYGILVHGNRIIAAATMKKLGTAFFKENIETFKPKLKAEEVEKILELTYSKITDEIEDNFAGKILSVLFKSPKNSKQVFDRATTK